MVNFLNGIPGVGDVNVSPEYTSKKVKDTYERLMQQLLAIFGKDAEHLTEEDYLAMQSILDQLSTLAKEGDPDAVPPAFLTSDMANKLKEVMTIMSQIGFVPGQSLDPSVGLQLMKTLKEFSVNGTTFSKILEWAVSGTLGQDQTLQSQLNAFLTEGSKYFEKELERLNDALKVNQAILDILQKLKDYRNGSISAPSAPGGTPGGGLVPPNINPNFTVEDIEKLRKELEAQLKKLQEEPINMKLGAGENNLADNIKAVLDDLDTITDEASLREWLMDGQDTTSGPNKGKFDKNLSNAITAGETLNENQKDLLNQSLYKMEQFQKIAGALLNAINQLIVSQAKAIGRG